MGMVSCVAFVSGAFVRTVTRSPRVNGPPETGITFAVAFVRSRPPTGVVSKASAESTAFPPERIGACAWAAEAETHSTPSTAASRAIARGVFPPARAVGGKAALKSGRLRPGQNAAAGQMREIRACGTIVRIHSMLMQFRAREPDCRAIADLPCELG